MRTRRALDYTSLHTALVGSTSKSSAECLGAISLWLPMGSGWTSDGIADINGEWVGVQPFKPRRDTCDINTIEPKPF